MEDSERKKAIELLKEMRSENKTGDDKLGNQETHLNWMYKGPSDLVDREEYLLGKAIDKNFEVLISGESSDVGRTGEQSNVPKRLLEKTDSLEQVDVAKKILEDPLYAIKQKEMEARKKLLNNPVKLKQIKQMLLERSKQNSSHKLKNKKLKPKSEQDLNFLILKKLKKFTDKEKRKALNKVIKSDFDSDSTESNSSNDSKDKKLELKRQRSYSSSDDYDSSSSSEKFSKKRKKKSESHKKKQKKKNKKSSSDSSSSDYERNKNYKGKTLNKKHFRKSFELNNENSAINEKVQKSKDKNLENFKNSVRNPKKISSREENIGDRQSKRMYKDKRNSFSGEERSFKKNYGLMVMDGSKLEKRKRESPVQKHQRSLNQQKSVESKAKYFPPSKVKLLSDKEREEKLRQMMEDAKLRKEDREKNLANHRKKQALEEKSKIYDDDFMRRQMSHLTSQGTMADRIKSNINNIQRSKSSMDVNFMRK